MKLWIALPANFNGLDGRHRIFTYSNSAMCPPKTLEMQQDNCDWFEVEVTRRMTDEKTPVKRFEWAA